MLAVSGLAIKVQRHDSVAIALSHNQNQQHEMLKKNTDSTDSENPADRQEIGAKLNR